MILMLTIPWRLAISVTVQRVLRYHHHLNQDNKAITINNNSNSHEEDLVGEMQVMAIASFGTVTDQLTTITTTRIIIPLRR